MAYEYLKKDLNQYASLNLASNPFTIAPLFRSFKNLKKCEKEEAIFVMPQEIEKEIQTLVHMQDRRALIYGLYGDGKTSLVDFILYLAYNFHKRLCLRVIITEDNVERAIHEMLLAVCFEILAELSSRPILKPLDALRKWYMERQRADFFIENILKLMGKYTETQENNHSSKKQHNLKASLGVIQADYGSSEEIEIRKSIQSYVEILPMRKVADYLEEFVQIAQEMGFRDIVIYIDEADHLRQLDRFLNMLTRAREVLFTPGYTFFVAGSVEIAKHTEAMGAIFDKLIFVPSANHLIFREILDRRIRAINSTLAILDIFEEDALQLILEKTRGVRKSFLRMAENALDTAGTAGSKKVTSEHCWQILSTSEDKISANLKESHLKILKYLAQHESASPSDLSFQEQLQVKRVQLRNILEELGALGYVRKEAKGRKIYYQIAVPYRPYFKGA
jgi:DNA-binding transcriptional ArsR family regulator